MSFYQADGDSENVFLEAALKYAGWGYPVFPLVPMRKEPATSNGFRDATTNPDQIREWWTENPRYNIGICTDGLVVIDRDGPDGMAWPRDPDQMADLALCGNVQETWSGGMHHVYRQPDGAKYGCTRGDISKGIDTRANGGYIVAAPSRISPAHYPSKRPMPGAKGAYQWLDGQELGPRGSLGVPPKWLAELLSRMRQSVNGGSSLPEWKAREYTPEEQRVFLESTPLYVSVYCHSLAEKALVNHGWQIQKILSSGEVRLTRPGKNPKDGCSASWKSPRGKSTEYGFPRLAIHSISEDADPFIHLRSEDDPDRNRRTYSAFDILRVYDMESIHKMERERRSLLDAEDCDESDWEEFTREYEPQPDGEPQCEGESGSEPVAEESSDSQWGQWEPFPIREVYEEYTADFLCSIAEALNVDPAMVAVPALSVLAGVIGLSRCVMLRESSQWIQHPVLWAAVASEPGTKKSAVMSLLKKPIAAADEKTVKQYSDDLSHYRAAVKEWKAKTEANDCTAGMHPKPPTLTEYILDDFTGESAARSLANNPRGMLIAEPELEALFASAMRYNSAGDHFRVFLQKLFDWEQIKVSRKGYGELPDPPTYVKGGLSISGMIQPSRWASCMKAAERGSGFALRWLTCMPPELPVRPLGFVPPPIRRMEAWEKIITQLISLEKLTKPVTLAPGAQSAFDSYDHYLETAKAEIRSNSEKGQVAKMSGITGRIALVLHMVDAAIRGLYAKHAKGENLFEPPSGPMVISEATMLSAIKCTEWFRARMAHTDNVGTASAQNLEDEPLLKYIRSIGGKVRPRDLQRHNSRRYPKADDARLTLERLAESKPPVLKCVTPGAVWQIL